MGAGNKSPRSNLTTALLVYAVLTSGFIVTGLYQQNHQRQEQYNPSFMSAMTTAHELAEKGCAGSFENCPSPLVVRRHIEDAMDREKIAFGTHDVTQDKLDQLQAEAEVKIASQKLAYLKAQGGAKTPSDVNLLRDICAQVYVFRRILPGNPSAAELRQLAPPSVTHVNWCLWDD